MKRPIFVVDMREIKSLLIVLIVVVAVIIALPMIIIGGKGEVENNNKQLVEDKQLDKTLAEYVSDGKIKVYISNEEKVEEINFEDYIKGVVASEMQVSFEIEALKAQAIAARNFALNKIKYNCTNGKGANVCDTTHCQVYKGYDVKSKEWGKSGEDNWNKICKAVDETKGEVMYFGEDIVTSAQFFATSSGKTENVKDVFGGDVPYLKSVYSEGEEIAPKYTSDKVVEYNKFINTINSNYKNAKVNNNNLKKSIDIKSHTEGGAVKEIKLGGETITGVEFRKLFELNSANFSLDFNNNKVNIHCKGYGHGVGMSQWGANAMAKNGKDYKDIITHYYSGVSIKKIY